MHDEPLSSHAAPEPTFAAAESIADAVEPTVEPRAVAGFWRRLAAFLTDSIVLGIVGLFLGYAFSDQLARLGGWGRFIGFIIALSYFGVFNSALRGGQTVGKRLLKIKVIDREGRLISLPTSLLRFTILGVPFFLNNALISASLVSSVFVSGILGVLIFGVGFAVVYLYIFNRGTRQSLHDLAAGTYVVRAAAVDARVTPPLWKGHLAVVGAWALIVIGLSFIVMPLFAQRGSFPDLIKTQSAIQDSGKVHAASVFIGQNYGPGGTTRYFRTTAVLKDKPTSLDETVNEIAAIVLREYPEAMQHDAIAITAAYGYDIGISSAWQSVNAQFTPQQWQERLQR